MCDVFFLKSMIHVRTARLTPLDVARPVFRAMLAGVVESDRPASSASARTIKPSNASLDPASALLRVEALRHRHSSIRLRGRAPRSSIADLNTHMFPHCIMENLVSASHQLCGDPESVQVDAVEELLKQTEEMGEDILVHMQTRLDDMAKDLEVVGATFSKARSLVNDVGTTVETVFSERLDALERIWEDTDDVRRRTTDSSGSEDTTVSSLFVSPVTPKDSTDTFSIVSGMSSCAFDAVSVRDLSVSGPPFSAPIYPSISHAGAKALRSTKSMADLTKVTRTIADDRSFLKLVSPWVKDVSRRYSKTTAAIDAESSQRSSSIWLGDTPEPVKSGVSKMKAWFRRKLMPDAPVLPSSKDTKSLLRTEIRPELSHSRSAPLPRGMQRQPTEQSTAVSAARVVRIANSDLLRIQECIEHAERYAQHADRSIEQARRLLAASLEVSLFCK
jgi:hypothetical protein